MPGGRELGFTRSWRAGLAVWKTRKKYTTLVSPAAKALANRHRSPQRPHRSARDRHERNSRSSTRLPSLVKPLATARRRRAEKVRARAVRERSPRKPIARNETSGDRIISRRGDVRDLNEAGGVVDSSHVKTGESIRRRLNARSVTSTRERAPGTASRDPRAEGGEGRSPPRAILNTRVAAVPKRARVPSGFSGTPSRLEALEVLDRASPRATDSREQERDDRFVPTARLPKRSIKTRAVADPIAPPPRTHQTSSAPRPFFLDVVFASSRLRVFASSRLERLGSR
jgi:hypothetical protein